MIKASTLGIAKSNARLDAAILRAEHAAVGAMFCLVALNILAGVVRERPATALGLTVLAGMIIGRRPVTDGQTIRRSL